MKQFISLVILGLALLINSSICFASANNTNTLYPLFQNRLENLCVDRIFSSNTTDHYQDYVAMGIALDKKIFWQNANTALAIVCFENPYAQEVAGNVISISNLIVQKVSTNLSSSELFFVMHNKGSDDHQLIAIKSTSAKQIQLQNTIKDKSGALDSKLVKQIPIKANQELALSDVGYHIMLINFNARLRAIDTVPLTLFFEDGSKIKLNAQVRCENFYQ